MQKILPFLNVVLTFLIFSCSSSQLAEALSLPKFDVFMGMRMRRRECKNLGQFCGFKTTLMQQVANEKYTPLFRAKYWLILNFSTHARTNCGMS
jgi:hypothetical protein